MSLSEEMLALPTAHPSALQWGHSLVDQWAGKSAVYSADSTVPQTADQTVAPMDHTKVDRKAGQSGDQ